jgi:hypothetical protein
LGLKSASAEERHFAVLCRDKIQYFFPVDLRTNMMHPDVFMSKIAQNTYNDFYTVLNILCSPVPHLAM